MTKQTSEEWKAKKTSRESDSWVGAELSISFSHLALITAPCSTYGNMEPVGSTVVKTFPETLERCPIHFKSDPVASYFCTSKPFFFFCVCVCAPNAGAGAVAHLLTNRSVITTQDAPKCSEMNSTGVTSVFVKKAADWLRLTVVV